MKIQKENIHLLLMFQSILSVEFISVRLFLTQKKNSVDYICIFSFILGKKMYQVNQETYNSI